MGAEADPDQVYAAVSTLAGVARAGATPLARSPFLGREVDLGRPSWRSRLGLRTRPRTPERATCVVSEPMVHYEWEHDGETWNMAVPLPSGTPRASRSEASSAAVRTAEAALRIAAAASGRAPPAATGGEALDLVANTARLAAFACCQSGDESATIAIVDERVVGRDPRARVPETTLSLSAQGAALFSDLPSTVLISADTASSPRHVDIRSPVVVGRMPSDPMERLRLLSECRGLPILYRWNRT